MRNYHILTAAIIAAVCILPFMPRAGADDKDKGDIAKVVGTWRLIGEQSKDGKFTKLADTQNNAEQIKFVTPTHFIWLYVSPDGQKLTQGFSGRVSLKGDTFTEEVEHISDDALGDTPADQRAESKKQMMKAYACSWRVEGDRWYHGYPMGGDTVQVWQRLKADDKLVK